MILSPVVTRLPNRRIFSPFLLFPILSTSCLVNLIPPLSLYPLSSTGPGSQSFMSVAYPFINATDAAALDAELMVHPGGFSIDQLMELAGLAVATAVYKVYPPRISTESTIDPSSSPPLGVTKSISRTKILVIAGPGNNGGDALVAARHLALWGYQPTVLYPKRPMKENKPVQLFTNLVNQLHDVEVPILDTLPMVKDILGLQRLQELAIKYPQQEKDLFAMVNNSSSSSAAFTSNSEDSELGVSSFSSAKGVFTSSSSSLAIEGGSECKGYDLILDGIFGFSFQGNILAPFDKIIHTLSLISEYTTVSSSSSGSSSTQTTDTTQNTSSGTFTHNPESISPLGWITRSFGIPIISIDIPSGWSVDHGPLSTNYTTSSLIPSTGGNLYPSLLVSLTAPKPCSKYFYGPYHYLGGRFIPPNIAKKYRIDTLPPYPGCEQVVRLS